MNIVELQYINYKILSKAKLYLDATLKVKYILAKTTFGKERLDR